MCSVPVKEIYFMAPKDHESSVNYFYYMTSSNVTSRGAPPNGGSLADDVTGGRVHSAAQTMSRVRQLTVTEAIPATLHCIASGGYPPPRLRMLVGDRDVTERFRRKWTWALRGVVGMRVIDIRSELQSVGWSVEASDDETIVRCTAFVDRQLDEQFAAVSLLVRRMYIPHPVYCIV